MKHHDDGDQSELSSGLHDETEKPGQPFSLETQMIIRDRYEFASQLAKQKRVLEIGCGAGLGLERLSKIAKSLNVADYSIENIKYLREIFSDKIQIDHVDAHEMIYSDKQFDLIVSLAMIYYLSLPRFLSEANRVLDHQGVLFFCTSNKDVPGFCAAPFTTDYNSIPELKNALVNAGFQPEFFGAFPASGGPLWKRKLRAIIKDGSKFAVCSLPGGKNLWRKLRKSGEGETPALPKTIDEMALSSTPRMPLEDDRCDHVHRVIYVVARKVT